MTRTHVRTLTQAQAQAQAHSDRFQSRSSRQSVPLSVCSQAHYAHTHTSTSLSIKQAPLAHLLLLALALALARSVWCFLRCVAECTQLLSSVWSLLSVILKQICCERATASRRRMIRVRANVRASRPVRTHPLVVSDNSSSSSSADVSIRVGLARSHVLVRAPTRSRCGRVVVCTNRCVRQ